MVSKVFNLFLLRLLVMASQELAKQLLRVYFSFLLHGMALDLILRLLSSYLLYLVVHRISFRW